MSTHVIDGRVVINPNYLIEGFCYITVVGEKKLVKFYKELGIACTSSKLLSMHKYIRIFFSV